MSGGLAEINYNDLHDSLQYTPQPNKFPVLVAYSSVEDPSLISASENFQAALKADGRLVVSCVHDGGHVVPPFEAQGEGEASSAPLWRFLFDHSYGLEAGQSPYLAGGLPEVFPDWCTVAK